VSPVYIIVGVLAVPFILAFAAGVAWREVAWRKIARVAGRQPADVLVRAIAATVRPCTLDERIALLEAVWDAEVLPGLRLDVIEAQRRKLEALRVPFPAHEPEPSPAHTAPHRWPDGVYVQFGERRSSREH